MSVSTNRYIFIYSTVEKDFDTKMIRLQNQKQIEALKLRARTNPHRGLVVGETSLADKEVELFNNNGCKHPTAFFNYIAHSRRNYLQHV